MPLLKCDIVSTKNAMVYGRAGDLVQVIATHGDVLIVKGIDNSRFAVHKNEVTETVDEISKQKTEVRPLLSSPTKTKSRKKIPNNQSDLFQ